VDTVTFLLNYAPRHWGTRDDMLSALGEALVERRLKPIFGFSKAIPSEVAHRYQSRGAEVRVIDTSLGPGHTRRSLAEVMRHGDIALGQIRFFNLYTSATWMLRLMPIRHLVLTDAEGGLLRATGWRKRLLEIRTRLMSQPAARVIGISEFVRGRALSLGVPPHKLTVVPNGVDTNRFRPDPHARKRLSRQLPLDSNDLLLLTAGNLLPIKHIEDLVRSCADLARRGVRFRFLVAGDGPLEPSLKQLAATLGVGDRILWLGSVPEPALLMQACDMFLFASVGEAFGNVLLEAMACGVPVVATRSGGIAEVVEDPETGRLVPPRDPIAFADAVEELAASSSMRQEMGWRGRRRAESTFGLEPFVRRTLAVYHDVAPQIPGPERPQTLGVS
jgi:glycosyltransferase involved in cell wall biosynthesis